MASCYRQSLELAEQYPIQAIAFPAISCGIYRYPIKQAAQIAIVTIMNWGEKPTTIDKVFLVCFGDDIFKAYCQQYQLIKN